MAWACLLDTLDVVASATATRKVLVLEGEPGPWIPACFDVAAQRGDGLGDGVDITRPQILCDSICCDRNQAHDVRGRGPRGGGAGVERGTDQFVQRLDTFR